MATNTPIQATVSITDASATAAAPPAAKTSPARRTRPVAARKSADKLSPPKAKLPPVQSNEASPTKPGKKSVKRPVLVRDSFTMPEADFALISKLKSIALGAHRAAKKSELLRAGLQCLAALDAESLAAALDRLEPVKTGRPKKGA